MLAVNTECAECGNKTPYGVYLCIPCAERLDAEYHKWEMDKLKDIPAPAIECPECGYAEHSCHCGYFASLEFNSPF